MPSTVQFQRVLRTRPERLYRVFIDPDAMAKWLLPKQKSPARQIMIRLIAALLAVGIGDMPILAFQARGGAKDSAGLRACSILTRDLVEPFAENKRTLDQIPPEEEAMPSGSACEWGIVRLQLYSTRPGGTHSAPKDYQALPGVGDTAFFHNNRDRYAELMVWSGSHHFTLQVSVPTASTAEAIKPKTIDLANAIIKKLR